MRRNQDVRVCVIGAGPSGITAAKNCLQVGVREVVVYEKGDAVGGNWIYSPRLSHSSVFETTHIISSKSLSQYLDFPMPEDYPDYPSQRQVLEYFQSYARHFGVDKVIQFNTEVVKAERRSDETWDITLGDGRVENFDYLLVANGHHWDPRYPHYPGEFTGEMQHSHDFKTNTPYKDKRVLVIGGGNSACDIAVETGRVSAFTAISWRRGYYILPKVIMGQPADVLNARMLFVPRRIRAVMLRWMLRLYVGSHARYNLQEPTDPIYSLHPVANSELLYFIKHGRVHPRRDIARFEGNKVHFVDGLVEEYDVVIAATGFYIRHPFFEQSMIDYSEGDVPLYLRVFHPRYRSLFFIGLVQPMGCIWPLSDAQAKLVANYIVGNYDLPVDVEKRIAQDVSAIRQTFVNSPRHTIEVDYHDHLGDLLAELPAHAPEWGAVRRSESISAAVMA